MGRITPGRGGFTLIELVVVTVLSVVILGASLAFAVSAVQNSEGGALREEVYRNARFIGMSLERDAQTTGIGIASDIRLGTLSTFNDTLVLLHVPWLPTDPYPYEIAPPPGIDNPLPAGGTCGATCINLNKAPDGTFDLVPGDLARLQINAERRVILVTEVVPGGSTVALTFSAADSLLHYESGLAGGVLLDRYSTIVQKLQPIVYFVENEVLYRSDQLDADGDLVASPVAYGVKAWDARMVFLDGDEADEADPDDLDYTNDFDDILGLRITATLAASRTHVRVAGGELFTRQYNFRAYPRNLMYERNR